MFDQLLVDAVIHVESRGDPKAVSSAGARGLMQVMDRTGREVWERIKDVNEGEYDPFNAAQNKRVGTAYLENLSRLYHGNIHLALAAYNWGMGNLLRTMTEHQLTGFEALEPHMPAETRAYVKNVLTEYARRVNEAGLTLAANTSGELLKAKA